MSKKVYALPVSDTAINSWSKVEGTKSLFWPGLIILIAISLTDYSMQTFTRNMHLSLPLAIAAVLTIFFLNLLVSAGLVHMGILRAKGKKLQWHMIFYAFNLKVILHLIGLIVLQSLILLIPSALIFFSLQLLTMHGLVLHIVAIGTIVLSTFFYLIIVVRMMLSVAFVLDRNEQPLKAVMNSIKVSKGNFWRLVGFAYMSAVIVAASALTFMIALIWALPFWYIWYGSVYLDLSKNNQR